MRWTSKTPRERLNFIIAVLSTAGFGGAVVIYANAGSPSANPLGYDPEDSKQYLRDMEYYGGKANVLASDLRHWFSGLWHGKTLALTVACLTAMVVLVLWYVATHLPAPADTVTGDEAERGGAQP